jgi:hypothetical protein
MSPCVSVASAESRRPATAAVALIRQVAYNGLMARHLLIASYPARRRFLEQLLAEVTRQTVMPDRLELVLDGYGTDPSPSIPAELAGIVREWRTPTLSGPGGRWRVARELSPDATVVVIDDDVSLQNCRNAVEALAAGVERGKTAMTGQGVSVDAAYCYWQYGCDGPMAGLQAGTCAFAAGDLAGLEEMRQTIVRAYRFDPLGDLGADEDLVSACLMRNGVTIRKATLPGVFIRWGTQDATCQTVRSSSGNYERQRAAFKAEWGWSLPRPRNLNLASP